ncbi:MAG TPA: FAD-dependent oxidoreductase [Candidatus Baltobacteraceae bacterium]|jgi:monoamine oxidase|nr:FAD-dependent oxidoreductase [Candidatus Baltobacteraceae bacterium]
MPRSAALQALQRLARCDGARAESVSRGDFARLLLGASAGALLSPAFTSCASSGGNPRIAIVGAGIAGLTAALQLHDAGMTATVYESAKRVGGRMHSEWNYWNDGQHTEWCGAMIDSKHDHMRALARRFGLPLVDTFAFMPPRSRDTSYFDGRYYPMAQADRDFAPVYRVLKAQLAQIGPETTYNRATPEAKRLDAISMKDWIERYVPGGLNSQLGRLIADAYWNENGVDIAQQSALNVVDMLGIQHSYPHDGEMNVLGYSDQRYFIAGGNQRLPNAIAASLPAGSVQLQHRLVAIRKRSPGGYDLRFETPGGPLAVTADRVVLAIPFIVLRGIDFSGAGFDSRKVRAINELGYGIHSKLHVQFDGRPWTRKGPWPDPADGQIWTDLGFQCSIDFTFGQRGKCGIVEFFTAGAQGLTDMPSTPYAYANESPAVRRHVRTYLSMLERVWPGTARAYNGKATLGNAQVDPNILASYSTWLVGQYTTIAGYEHVRQDGVHFAGEHCSVDHQGFMEGGARTGAAAAREILAEYGVRVGRAG